jgi:hypothetical protein
MLSSRLNVYGATNREKLSEEGMCPNSTQMQQLPVASIVPNLSYLAAPSGREPLQPSMVRPFSTPVSPSCPNEEDLSPQPPPRTRLCCWGDNTWTAVLSTDR